MKKINVVIYCDAVYTAVIDAPEGCDTQEAALEYVESVLDQIPAENLEWIGNDEISDVILAEEKNEKE